MKYANLSSEQVESGVVRIYGFSKRYHDGWVTIDLDVVDPASISVESGYEYTAALDESTGFVLLYRRTLPVVDEVTLEHSAPHGEWGLVSNLSKEAAKVLLADVRYNYETGGVALADGTMVDTGRGSQGQINSAYNSLKNGLIASTEFKAKNAWVTMSFAEFEPIAKAVAEHVSNAFAYERIVSEDAIDPAASLSDLMSLDLNELYESAVNGGL